MRQKKTNIPKFVDAQEKYQHHHVLPRIQDERSQRRLSKAVAIIFMLVLPCITWLIIQMGFNMFNRGWIFGIMSIILLLASGVMGWYLGSKIVKRAIDMKVRNYKKLYSQYEHDLQEVSEAREVLMRAEGRLADTEYKLEKLLASTHNRPILVASFAAITAVVVDLIQGDGHQEKISAEESMIHKEMNHPDFTDNIVQEHDKLREEEESKT